MSNFITQVDFSTQVKEYQNTDAVLSGSVSVQQYTVLGTDYSDLPLGLDNTTTGVTNTITPVTNGYFTGTTGSTTFYFSDSNMDIGIPYVSAITNSNSGITQNIEAYQPISTIIVDGNSFDIYFSGVSYNLTPINVLEYTPGEFSGDTFTNVLTYLSGSTYPWWFLKSGSTTWNEVKGRTKTDRLTVVDGAVNGYVLTSDSYGNATWQIPSITSTTITTNTPYIFDTSNYSIIPLSGSNTTQSEYSNILGGTGNTITNTASTQSSIINGTFNNIDNTFNSFVGNGYQNIVTGGTFNTILNGVFNKINDLNSIYSWTKLILSGVNNKIVIDGGENNFETILNGNNNTISGYEPLGSTILNGENNVISGISNSSKYVTIINGRDNVIIDSPSSIIFGKENFSINSRLNFIFGNNNTSFDNLSYFDGVHVIMGSYSQISGDTENTIILGSNITGTSSNTVYTPDLVIKKYMSTPTTSGDTIGEVGSVTWDNNYIYVKTISGWGRTLLDYSF
jgi:hypothetical protein